MFAVTVSVTTSWRIESVGSKTVVSVHTFRKANDPSSPGCIPAQYTVKRTPPWNGEMFAACMWRAEPMNLLTGNKSSGSVGTMASATVTATYDLRLIAFQKTVQMECLPSLRHRTRPCCGMCSPPLGAPEDTECATLPQRWGAVKAATPRRDPRARAAAA